MEITYLQLSNLIGQHEQPWYTRISVQPLWRCDMRQELLTQCAFFCYWSRCKKGHAESAFRDVCRTLQPNHARTSI